MPLPEVNRANLKHHVKHMEKTVAFLEDNIKESFSEDNQLIMSFNTDKIKNEGLSNQLEEALKENKQLLNILQQKCSNQDVSRTSSQLDLSSSCSTMSIVHLQYKYEELLANHHGLLKFLESKTDEVKKLHEENIHLKEHTEQLKFELCRSNAGIQQIEQKIEKLRNKKNCHIRKLKSQKETLQLVHNQLINLLNVQCIEKDNLLSNEIRKCPESGKALLLQEIKKNNALAYENFKLKQRVDCLCAVLQVQRKTVAMSGAAS